VKRAWADVAEIFEAAAALTGAERNRVLDERCSGNAELRREVESLLAQDDVAGDYLTPPHAAPSLRVADPADGAIIGGFRLIRRLGSGGMGSVHEAEQTNPSRRVALKILPPLADDPAARRRFAQEAELLARMNHVSIAQVFAAGVDGDTPFLAMELVEGALPVTDYAERSALSRLEAVALFRRVCAAVAHGHAKGVVHRDIKPSNVLVDAHGTPKVIDFGIARALDAGDADAARMTRTGDLIGTLQYMSPEQAEGRAGHVDAQSDVHALGLVLYEMLCGRRAYALGGRSLTQALLSISQEAVPLARSVRPDLPAELEWILAKALEKDRSRRYSSVVELDHDLGRFVDHEPVLAGPPSRVYVARLWVRRHPTATAVLGMLAVALVVVGLLGLSIVAREREVFRLADAEKLRDLERRAELLWPALPARAAAMEDWLGEARALSSNLEAHRATLTDIRRRARPDEQTVPREPDRRWTFADPSDAWWHSRLTDLVAALEAFGDPDTGLVRGTSPEHGLGVERRFEFARQVEQLTLVEPAERWRAAIEAVAKEPRYGGLTIAPRIGLVPLGADPDSGLQEFADIAAGTVPARGADGRLALEPASAVVFVLVPAGHLLLGAQAQDPGAPQFDPQASEHESPLRDLDLDAFFLAKHELTQEQWRRATGANPSLYAQGMAVGTELVGSLHPVENVSWNACARVLARQDWSFPTEAQWEYAARAGTTTPWWTGSDPSSLQGAANLSDRHCQTVGPPHWRYESSIDDGRVAHAPIGSYRANAFGLHDVCGNVFEWCADAFASHAAPMRPGDGLVLEGGEDRRVARGGSFENNDAYFARSSNRNAEPPGQGSGNMGVRPARRLSP